jgi:hypothetical protein
MLNKPYPIVRSTCLLQATGRMRQNPTGCFRAGKAEERNSAAGRVLPVVPGRSCHQGGAEGRARGLRLLHLAQLTFTRHIVARLNDRLVPASVSSQSDRDRRQPLHS